MESGTSTFAPPSPADPPEQPVVAPVPEKEKVAPPPTNDAGPAPIGPPTAPPTPGIDRTEAELVAGAADLPVNQEESRQAVPDWVLGVGAKTKERPTETLTVSRNGGANRFRSIKAALAAIKDRNRGPVLIELEGEGPFPLPPTVISDRARIMIRGNGSSVIACDAAGLPPNQPYLLRENGPLDLEQL